MLIELIITDRCTGKCFDCLQGCGLFPTNDMDMNTDDVNKFADYLLDNNETVDTITIMGGEPLFNPQWKQILEILTTKLRPITFRPITILHSILHPFKDELNYIRTNYNTITLRKTELMWSNKTKDYFDPYDVAIVPSYNSIVKPSDDGYRYVNDFIKINNSILDFDIKYSQEDIKNCSMKNLFGFSYNKNGWYQCCIGNMIDRVFNFNLACDSPKSDMSKQNKLCLYCGFFVQKQLEKQNLTLNSKISKSWNNKL